MPFWKDSMINQLSNIINRNRLAAKISQVLCSNFHAKMIKRTMPKEDFLAKAHVPIGWNQCIWRIAREVLSQHTLEAIKTFVAAKSLRLKFSNLSLFKWSSLMLLFLSPSGDLWIGLGWDNLSPPHKTPPQLFGPTVAILFKLNWIICEGSSVVLRMVSDDFQTRFRLGSD